MLSHSISRRKLSALLAAAGVTAGTATVGLPTLHKVAAAAAQDGEVTIEYWHRSSGDAATTWEELASDFNAEFAGKVQVRVIAQGSIAELNQKVRTAAAGGGMPGALMADDSDVMQYAANGLIVDIDPYIADPENGLTQEEIDAFLPNQYDRQKLAIYNDQRMAFPQGFSAATLFWNQDALEAAGFDAPVATWQELPDHLRALAEANPGMVPFALLDAGAKFVMFMKTYGVEWLKEDGETANFDAPEALEIMTWWKELNDEGLMQIFTEGAVDLLVSQQVIYLLDSSGGGRGIAIAEPTFTWSGGLPLQGATDGELRTVTYGPINTLPATSEAEQLAGWTWLKWLATPEPLSKWVATTSYFPSVPAVADEPMLAEFYETYPVVRQLVDSVAPYASLLTPHAALSEVTSTICANNVNEVLLGRLTPEEGVQKMQMEANDAIARATGA